MFSYELMFDSDKAFSPFLVCCVNHLSGNNYLYNQLTGLFWWILIAIPSMKWLYYIIFQVILQLIF